MQTEYDDNVIDYWKLPNKNYIVKMKKDDGLDDDGCDIKNTLPALLGAFLLSNSKRIMNDFVREMFITLILIHCILKENSGVC